MATQSNTRTYPDYLLAALTKGPATVTVLATRTNTGVAKVQHTLQRLDAKVKLLDSGRYALRGWKALVFTPAKPPPPPAEAPKSLVAAPATSEVTRPAARPAGAAKLVDPLQVIANLLTERGPMHYGDIIAVTQYPVSTILKASEAGLIQFDFPNKVYYV